MQSMQPTQLIWTTEQVLSLAPDNGIAKSARVLAIPAKWHNLQIQDGIATGSFVVPKRTSFDASVNLHTLQFNCTCKNRKFPCNHAISLLLMAAKDTASFSLLPDSMSVAELQPDVRVSETLSDEDRKRERALRRGLAQFAQWLEDLVRNGLATLPSLGREEWAALAARLVDAHAPSLAREVRTWQKLVDEQNDWVDAVLARIGRIYLLIRAFDTLDNRPSALWNDLHSAVGWLLKPHPDDTLVHDSWLVAGQTREQSGKRLVRHSWLLGQTSGRVAKITRISTQKRSVANPLVTGVQLDATVRFFMGGVPIQAEIESFDAQVLPQALTAAGQDWQQITAAYAHKLSSNPWLGPLPVVLRKCQIVQTESSWMVQDENGLQVAVSAENSFGWHLKSTEGNPLIGLWDGTSFLPLSIWLDQRLLDFGLLRGIA